MGKSTKPLPAGRVLFFIFLIIGVLAVIGLVILLALKQPESSIAPDASDLSSVSMDFPSDHAVMASLMTGETFVYAPGEVTVLIPAGAVSENGSLSINPREANLFPDGPGSGWDRPIVINIDYYDQNGTLEAEASFTVPVEICFVLEDATFDQAVSKPTDYQVQVYLDANDPPAWQGLATSLRSETRQICARSNHLSLFAVAVRRSDLPAATATPGGLYNP